MHYSEIPDNQDEHNGSSHGKVRSDKSNKGNKKQKTISKKLQRRESQSCPAHIRARMVACVCGLLYQHDLTPLLLARFCHMPSNKYQAKFLVYAVDARGKVNEYNIMYKDQKNTYITRIGNMAHLFYLRSVCLRLVRELMVDKPKLPIILPDAYVLPLTPVALPGNLDNYAHIS